MGNTDTSTQQPDIVNFLATGGASSQNQSNIGDVLKGLLQYAQNTPSPQSANAALGPSTTNVLNNAATATGDPSVAAGNYDASQGTGINQQQLAQVLQTLAQTNKQGATSVDNQPNTAQPMTQAQQIQYDSAKKNLTKYYDNHAKNTSPATLEQYVNQFGGSQPGQGGQNEGSPNPGGQAPAQTPSNPPAMGTPIPATNNQPNSTKPIASATPNGSQPSAGMPDAIQEQAHRIALEKPGLLGSIFRGVYENNKRKELENLELGQKITQGGAPLSPKDKVEAVGNWNSALLKQHQDFQSDLSEQMKSNVEGMDSFVKNTPLPTKVSDWTGYNQKLQEYHDNIKNIAEKQLQGFNKFKNLQLTNPMNGQKGNRNFGAGDSVMYNGRQRIIKSINEKTGTAILQ